jgi:hypothetical protein
MENNLSNNQLIHISKQQHKLGDESTMKNQQDKNSLKLLAVLKTASCNQNTLNRR